MHSKKEKLKSAIREALNVLGTGECPQRNCEGCEWETHEAIRILKEALRG